MINLYLIGDSHIGCLATAYKATARAVEKPSYKLRSHSLGGGAVAYDLVMLNSRGQRVVNPLLRMAITNANTQNRRDLDAAGGVVAICAGGYITSVYTWEQRSGEFDLLENVADQDIADSVLFVPRQMVKDSLLEHFKGLAEAIGEVCKQTNMPVMYVSAPPPYRDNADIVARMSEKRGVAADACPQPMAPAVRLKVWKIAREVLREQLEPLAVPFVDIPHDSVDREGFLRKEYYGDGFHANADYGSLMLREVVTCGQKIVSEMTVNRH